MTTLTIETLQRADEWRDFALCRLLSTPELFFPPGSSHADMAQLESAKQVCRACPVRLHCASWALARNMRDGVWGALDEAQRRSIQQSHPSVLGDPDELRHVVEAEWHADIPIVRLRDAYLERTEQGDDGHVLWTRSTSSFRVAGALYTPSRLAFTFGYGRLPEGPVVRACGEARCVAAEHLTDAVLRRQRLARAA
ncbi:WhiB family transcriptional regulator [Streptomyces sp. NPDC059352]|uniref:WhiB family transcriptional regulator n=1 Tax=Streptomyces sp. NPDC059352 TaxID=3346810 RepID=UPI00367E885B